MKRYTKNKQNTPVRKAGDQNTFSGAHSVVVDASNGYRASLSLCSYSHQLISFLFLLSRLAAIGIMFYRSVSHRGTSSHSNFCLILSILHSFFMAIDVTITATTYIRVGRSKSALTKQIPCAVPASKLCSYLKCVISYYYILQDLLFIVLIFNEDSKVTLNPIFFSYSLIFILSLSFLLYHKCYDNYDKQLRLKNQLFEKPHKEEVINDNQSCEQLLEPICPSHNYVIVDELKCRKKRQEHQEPKPISLPSSPPIADNVTNDDNRVLVAPIGTDADVVVDEVKVEVANVSADTDINMSTSVNVSGAPAVPAIPDVPDAPDLPIVTNNRTTVYDNEPKNTMKTLSISVKKDDSTQKISIDQVVISNNTVSEASAVHPNKSKSDKRSDKQNSIRNITESTPHIQHVDKQHSNTMNSSSKITTSVMNPAKVSEPISMNIKQSSKLKNDQKSSRSVNNSTLSICTNRIPNAANKKGYKSMMSQSSSIQSSSVQSSKKGPRKHYDMNTSTKALVKSKKDGRMIIPSHMDGTIIISSHNIPRSGATSIDSERDENTSVTSTSICAYINGGSYANQAPNLDYIDPEIGISGAADISLELEDLADFDELNQYGQDNVKCIGAAATRNS